MSPARDDVEYLSDILIFIDAIAEFIAGIDLEVVWATATEGVPGLRQWVLAAIETERRG